jgi:DNA-binding NtrC family response regulator
MSTLWIVHRDSRRRAELARAAGTPASAVSGGPGDPLFDSAARADVVLLGLAGDFEAELEFAHQVAGRLPDARWVLVAERTDIPLALELFDAIDAEILGFPPDARTLRAKIRSAKPRSARLPLSMRPARDLLSQRFSRWFADLEMPSLLHSLDPHLGDSPLLILGADGSGRGLLARYVHGFGQHQPSQFVHVVCTEEMTGAQLRNAIGDAAADVDAPQRATLWLDQTDALSNPAQRQLARWIEFGLPVGTVHCQLARWIATASDDFESDIDRFEPALRDALSGLSIRIPSLRERPHLIAPFANATALAWCAAHRQNPRRLGEDAISVLEEYPWAGNLRELEAVVVQTLVTGAGDPIRADELQYDGAAFAPINADEVGVLIDSPELPEFDEFETANRGSPTPPIANTPHRAVPLRKAEHEERARQSQTQQQEPQQEQVENEVSTPDPSASAMGIERLVGAIAHEIRNPLSTISTFAELLPNRFDDPEFRETFTKLVGQDARRIEGVVAGLAGLASLTPPNPVRVDIAQLLEELLEQRRTRVHERKLLVMKDLEPNAPPAWVDEQQIRFALDSVLDKTIELAPERGDVYVGAQHDAVGLRGGPATRVLIRFGGHAGLAEPGDAPRAARVAGVSAADNALSFAIAEAIVRRQSGEFAIGMAESDETVLRMDIPTARD